MVSENQITELVKLPHPKNGDLVLFLVVRTKGKEERRKLYEVIKYHDTPSSWFIAEELVKADGSFYLVTQYDPLYLLLPFFERSTSKTFQVLDQMIQCEHSEVIIESLREEAQVQKISDVAVSGDVRAYRYNEEKTLMWLKKKVNNLVDQLSTACVYLPQEEDDDSDRAEKENKQHCAWGIISEYLTSDMKEKLRVSLGISVKRKKLSQDGSEKSAKKVKASEDYSNNCKALVKASLKPMSRTERNLKKIDKKGMKSISSFFKPKGA